MPLINLYPKKAIVTTTIHDPSYALHLFANKEDWKLFIVGDLKTPHKKYEEFVKQYPDTVYLDPEIQESKYRQLSDALGWNCIQRRNVGFVEAYKWGAEIIATIDDDNLSLNNWGEKIYIHKKPKVELYDSTSVVSDPLYLNGIESTNQMKAWHRGFPIQLVDERNGKYIGRGNSPKECLIQAGLWEGSLDVDAIARIAGLDYQELVEGDLPFTSLKPMPFNSQNTLLSRKIFPIYFLFPFIGRFDDIWAAYITQYYFPHSVVFHEATVYQARNPHNLVKDLQDEMFGYEHTIELVNDMDHWQKYLPAKSLEAYEVYKSYF